MPLAINLAWAFLLIQEPPRICSASHADGGKYASDSASERGGIFIVQNHWKNYFHIYPKGWLQPLVCKGFMF